MTDFSIQIARDLHIEFAPQICAEMETSALVRGTGIAKRSPEYLAQKIREGKAVIALGPEGQWAGFCYIETWQSEEYVANSGLIINPEFRRMGLATMIKEKIFELSRSKFPDAKIFGLTTGLAVMKINSDLGYEPVTYSELTTDELFWSSCKSCVNYDILTQKGFKNCLCTAMLYDPKEKEQPQPVVQKPEYSALPPEKRMSVRGRIIKLKQTALLKDISK
ncbi:MAG: GNAT family N-acetyltransferase [Bacteroidota bacterium]|nr:GNAT family N-acetyltransferase [Bacteroidota bacterium]